MNEVCSVDVKGWINSMCFSHDRRFLNNVCTDIMHLTNKKLEYYKGDYDTFERTRAERAKHAERAGEAAESRRKHVQAFIDKFRYNAKRASLVQSRIKALERMEVMDVGEADDPRWKFEFPDPGVLGIPGGNSVTFAPVPRGKGGKGPALGTASALPALVSQGRPILVHARC